MSERTLREFRDRAEPLVPMPDLQELQRRATGRRRLRIAGGAAVLAAAVAVGTAVLPRSLQEPTVEPSEDVFAQVEGWITFRSGTNLVAVDPTNPDDTVVLGPSHLADPIAWSSDGTKLLLRFRQDPKYWPTFSRLFVLHADGSPTTLVPEKKAGGDIGGAVDVFPTGLPTWGSFSPDGTEVAFASDGTSRGPYVIDADGGTPRRLGPRCEGGSEIMPGVQHCGEPLPEAAAWSPDGSRIAWLDFVEDSAMYGHHASVLSFVNPDGTGLREEAAPLPGEGAESLVWSPDGSRLAFSQTEDQDGPAQVFVINADGSGLQQITQDGDNRWPTWSPDGSRIAFVCNGTLCTMSPDGTDVKRVEGVQPDGAIAWNPVK